MSEEQFRFIGARFEDLEKQMKVLAEANLMTREFLMAEIQTVNQAVNQRIDGLEANLGRFAERVAGRFDKLETETENRFDKLENRFDTFETQTAKRFDKLENRFDTFETQTAKRFDKLDSFRDDTQQRLKRIEENQLQELSSSSRTPQRTTRTSLTRRRKKS
jgi:hypothetical protein